MNQFTSHKRILRTHMRLSYAFSMTFSSCFIFSVAYRNYLIFCRRPCSVRSSLWH